MFSLNVRDQSKTQIPRFEAEWNKEVNKKKNKIKTRNENVDHMEEVY